MGYREIRDRVIPRQDPALRAYHERRRAARRSPRPPAQEGEEREEISHFPAPEEPTGHEVVRGLTGESMQVPRYTPPGADRVMFTRKKRGPRRNRTWCSVHSRYVSSRNPCEHYPDGRTRVRSQGEDHEA